MAIIVDLDTRLVVQGLTGSEGRFHGLRNRAYGTNLVAGVTPGKGGQDVEGVPVFDTVAAGRRRGGREHGDDLRARALRARRDLRGGRRRHPHRHLHLRAHPGARDAARLHLHPAEGRDADRAELPGRAVAGQGERRDHPGRGLPAREHRPRLALGDADLPDRPRGRPARSRQLDDRRHRRRPGRRLELHRHPREVRGGSRDRVRRARRRDRRRRGGEGGAPTSPRTCRSRCSRTSPASRRRPARRWATRARSSPAPRARRRRRRMRSRPRGSRSARRRPRSPSSSSPLPRSARPRPAASAGSARRARAFSTVAVPPCAVAASRTMASPSPAPGFERAVAAR